MRFDKEIKERFCYFWVPNGDIVIVNGSPFGSFEFMKYC